MERGTVSGVSERRRNQRKCSAQRFTWVCGGGERVTTNAPLEFV